MTLTFDCRYTYAGGFALDATFETDGGVTAICGPSGSGKTTILSLIAGLLRPASGRIALDGRVLDDAGRSIRVPPRRRDVGLVFQDNLLFPHLTVRGNLSFGARRGGSRDVSLSRVTKVLELDDLLDRLPATLSGGQARRVALGRALLRGPRLLLLDEPLTGVHDELKAKILAALERSLAEWKVPTILVSHDQPSVESLANRVLHLRDGRVR